MGTESKLLCIACPIFMLFLYWLSELQRLKFSCSFRAFSRTFVHHCARTHAALQINLYGRRQVLTLRTLAMRLYESGSKDVYKNIIFASSVESYQLQQAS